MLNPTMKETEIVDNTVLLIEKFDIQFTQLNQQNIYKRLLIGFPSNALTRRIYFQRKLCNCLLDPTGFKHWGT